MAKQFSNILEGLAGSLGQAAGQAAQQNALQAQAMRVGQVFRVDGQQQMDALAQQAQLQQHQHFDTRRTFRRDQMGSYMGQAWPRQPIPVFCDGWKSDTLALERHGYKFMVEHDIQRRAYRIAIGKAGARSMIMIEELYYERWLQDRRPIEFHGEFITRMEVERVKVEREVPVPVFVEKNMNDAYWCETEMMQGTRRAYDVRDLFPQSQTAPESQIVLPDAKTVTEVLDLLLEKQTPRREEVRDQQRRRERKVATILQLEEEVA